jgi:spermidine/putrescine transport system substrate-binding protein
VTTFHPREPHRLARREFLRRSALGAVGLALAPSLLAACGGDDDGDGTATELPLARPDSPVTLPLYDDNAAIASGLDPEGGPLRIYNWVDYLWPKKLKEFGKEYGVDVEVTTFSTMDEAIAKLASGAANFDVFFPTTDRISRLAYGKLVQPLNRDYVPNLANVWTALQDPFYDQGSRYTVPYVTYSTGIGYRRDRLGLDPATLDNPYDVFWDEALRGKVWLLDDAREAIALALLRKGETDVNTEDPALIDAAKADLLDLISAVNVKVSTEDYSKVPEGVAPVHQAWSGSMIAAQWYLPEGVGTEQLGFWFPSDGRGPIGSDQMAVLRAAKNPVLAHHFLDFMLDEKNAYDNFAQFVGYQPPLTSLDPDRLVADEVVPPSLRGAVVRESDFQAGLQELELSPDGQVLWQNAWAEFKAGL